MKFQHHKMFVFCYLKFRFICYHEYINNHIKQALAKNMENVMILLSVQKLFSTTVRDVILDCYLHAPN